MNCESCKTELEDFLYGELDAVRQVLLNEHLSVCAECRAVQVALERENELFAQFYEQNALDPSDELWQAIHTHISEEASSRQPARTEWQATVRNWFAPLLAPAMMRQAAFAVLLILVSVGLTTWYFSARKEETRQTIVSHSPMPSPTATATPVPAPETKSQPPRMPKENSPVQLATRKAPASKPESNPPVTKLSEDQALSLQIAKATREYQGAIRLLEATLAKRKSQLDEGTIKQFEGSLALIDASIASSREALRAHPNDPTAARFLLAAYSRKVELMQEIAMR